jgi:hypothetical protein
MNKNIKLYNIIPYHLPNTPLPFNPVLPTGLLFNFLKKVLLLERFSYLYSEEIKKHYSGNPFKIW